MDQLNELMVFLQAAVVSELVIYLFVSVILLRVIVVINNVSHSAMPLLRLWAFGGSYIMLAVGAVIVAINLSHSHQVDISDLMFIGATVGLIASNRRTS